MEQFNEEKMGISKKIISAWLESIIVNIKALKSTK